jgi:hypothetical protein
LRDIAIRTGDDAFPPTTVVEEQMKNNLLVLSAATAMTATVISYPAFAQPAAPQPAAPQQTCLQSNRIWSWNAVNDRLLIVTDVQYHRYIVRLSGGCIGLSVYPLMALRFNTWTDLGCLRRGDTVEYRAPALGRLNCFVNEVQPYSPELLAQDKQGK